MILVVIALIGIIASLIYLLKNKAPAIRFGIPLILIIIGIISFFIFQNYIFPYEDHVPIRASGLTEEERSKARESRMKDRERQKERTIIHIGSSNY